MKIPFLEVNTIEDYSKFFTDESWVNFLISHINPLYSISRIKAKVVGVVEETPSTKSFLLKPNHNWKGFKPGQHCLVSVNVKGRILSRYYSITSAQEDKFLKFTIKKQKDGIVSNFIHEEIKKGSILEIGQAEGNFVLENKNDKLLFIAGGSGITPLFSILKSLENENKEFDIHLVYYSTIEEEIIFKDEIETLKNKIKGLKVEFILTDEKKDGYRKEFLEKKNLKQICSDFEDRLVYLCGPESLQLSAEKFIDQSKIKKEVFKLFKQSSLAKKQVKVELLKTGKTLEFKGEKPLLEELEENGIYPLHGCRMGICHTCACKKESGVVQNLQSGEISDFGEETIQLCITRAEEDIKLNL